MNCMSCGASLASHDMDYCPYCGSNVQAQRRVEYLSMLYYNRGLEKAEIRDLSGAITCLRISLMFNKENIQARNLLGLVYYETGEVVSALSEWVISKNLKKKKNLANEYIDRLRENPAKLETINETIRKYNTSLELCKKGHEDMAMVQLKKLLMQNPKLIKGYHLLALLQIKEKSWGKARRTLKKALKIDRTNTTTLRFLKEIEERTGVTTKASEKKMRRKKRGNIEQEDLIKGSVYYTGTDVVIQPPAYKERSFLHNITILAAGFLIGGACLYYMAVPTIRQGIYREANQQIMEYGDVLVGQEAELSQIKGEISTQDQSQVIEQLQQQVTAVSGKSNSYQALLAAYQAMQEGQPDVAAEYIQKVDPSTLNETAKTLYDSICKKTNESGSEGIYQDGTVEDIFEDQNTDENYFQY